MVVNKTHDPMTRRISSEDQYTERLRKAKQRIEQRLDGSQEDQGQPMFAATNIRMELADKVRAIGVGGIGLVHQLAREVGLVDAIDRHVHLLKIHRPYHESDHVLNLGLQRIVRRHATEDIELRRNDEVFLDALGTQRIPDPTTAGDFCRRFDEASIRSLMQAADEARLNVWARQPKKFFDRATIDLDGTLVVTTGECKGGWTSPTRARGAIILCSFPSPKPARFFAS